MDKKKKIVIIVAVIVIIAAIITAIILIVNKSNKDKEYIDTVVTEIVTDDNGERVTDEQGEIVTQVVTEVVTNEDGETVTDKEGKPVTQIVTNRVDQNGDNNSNQNNNVNGGGNGGNNGSNSGNNGTDSGGGSNSGENSTSENVTYKSRKVTVDVVLPYYNKQETELTLSYKVDGDKNYKKLDPVKVKLDKSGKVESFDLGELKGNVTVTVSFSGITISENTIIINGQDSTGKIKPVTGIEIIDGEDD